MRIELPEVYNTRQVKQLIKNNYPDLEFKIVPLQYVIEGAGEVARSEGGFIRIDTESLSREEKARIELEVKQALFEIVPEKTDQEEKEEEELKNLLLRPEIVYLVNQLAELEKRLEKLEKKDDKIKVQIK